MSSPVRQGAALSSVREFDVPRLCDLGRSSTVLGSVEWAMACQIDGRGTVGELAGRCGIPLGDAAERVARLIRDGLCTIEPAPGPGLPVQPGDFLASLPRRVREPAPAAGSPLARLDAGLLKRILDGLNSLE